MKNKLLTTTGALPGMLVVAFILLLGVNGALAQASSEGWSPPVNLSRSGSSNSPVMVVDNEGTIHVVWVDEFFGAVYTRNVDGEWTEPAPREFPFETFEPALIADNAGAIHAFWVAAGNDLSTLNYSRISVAAMDSGSWTTPEILAESVLDFDVAVDEQGNLHLSYVQSADSEDSPAGVYYRYRGENGVWTQPALLYQSLYFRGLAPEEANVEIALLPVDEETQNIFVAWDNRPRKKLLMSYSQDGGETWSEPLTVAAPLDITDTDTPQLADFASAKNSVLLIWREVQDGAGCTQFFQVFSSDGTAASDPRSMLEELPGCPEENRLLAGSNGLTLLRTSVLNRIYLLAWDGKKWSLPQPQEDLSSFIDPDTSQPFTLQCMQTVLVGENELLMVGCDAEAGGDIWFTSSKIADVSDWFSSPSIWSQPDAAASVPADISSLVLLADARNRLHAVWVETLPAGDTINYARWREGGWTSVLATLQPPSRLATNLSAALGPKERLLIVWSNGEIGEIYFSWTGAGEDGRLLEWAEPVPLPMPRPVGSSPDIVVDDQGTITVVYTIPLNEDRGVYVTQSEDNGTTWSDPVQVLDGLALGWEMVARADLSRTLNGRLHVLAARSPLPGGTGTSALFYTASQDGITWTVPAQVTEGEVVWAQIQGVGASTVYRIWQEMRKGVIVTWLETSTDNGLSWSAPVNFAGLEARMGPASLALDRAGQLHLLQLAEEIAGLLQLREWVWNGENWTAIEHLELGPGSLSDQEFQLASSVLANDFLGVVISRPAEGLLEEGTELLFTGRRLELPAEIPQSQPAAPSTPSPTATPLPTPTPTPTPTPLARPAAGPANQNANPFRGLDTRIVGPAIGFIASSLVVLVIFAILRKLGNRSP